MTDRMQNRPPDPDDRLARLEVRVAQLEAAMGLAAGATTASTPSAAPVAAATPAAESPARPMAAPQPANNDFEFEVGQSWFALVGISALAVGGGFMLTLPYPGVPEAVPALVGFALSAVLFALAHWGATSFALVSRYLRGTAMVLLYCATLRLLFFGRPVLAPASTAGIAVLTAASLANLAIAWVRRSRPLTGLALMTAAATPVAIGTGPVVLVGCALLAVATAVVTSRRDWHPLLPVGIVLTYGAYLAWAVGDPFIGGAYHWQAAPSAAPLVALLCAAVFGVVRLGWRDVPADTPAVAAAALLNCGFGYGVFLLHTVATSSPHFVGQHAIASLLFLCIAVLLWRRLSSQVATFFYAMAGYAALSAAIVSATAVPEVFVWLSVESVIVVATAIWFRSRFIVVTNFVIYVLVVGAYLFLNERETGVSIGFGLVALVSARVLNWQRHRLALKTELMRNAYLLSAFVVFPYALYHLASPRYAALAWIGMALAYYGLHFAISNQKYRWMGHGTLLLTLIYLLVPNHPGFTSTERVTALVVLGAVLVAVSLLFTRSRQPRKAAPGR